MISSRRNCNILLSAFWTTIYEPFIHHFTWEQMENHCRIVCRLFHWHDALDFSRGRSPLFEGFSSGHKLVQTNLKGGTYFVSTGIELRGSIQENHLSFHCRDAVRHHHERSPLFVSLSAASAPSHRGGCGARSTSWPEFWPSPSAVFSTLFLYVKGLSLSHNAAYHTIDIRIVPAGKAGRTAPGRHPGKGHRFLKEDVH